MYIIFAEFGIIRTFGLSVCIVVGPKQNLWCIKCTGALLKELSHGCVCL